MKIYIASSWKNQHAVEMLTKMLRDDCHTVLSFVDNNGGECDKGMPFDEWVETAAAQKCFAFDVEGATRSDCVIYIGPSGNDAWAEVGAAWANCIPVFGLWSKGEQSGLMRKMVSIWHLDYRSLIENVDLLARQLQKV